MKDPIVEADIYEANCFFGPPVEGAQTVKVVYRDPDFFDKIFSATSPIKLWGLCYGSKDTKAD